MSLDWDVVGGEILSAVSSVVKASWHEATPAVKAQVQAVVAAGQQILEGKMSKHECDSLKASIINSLQFTLLMEEGIGLLVAQEAAAAAWSALTTALKTAEPALSFLF